MLHVFNSLYTESYSTAHILQHRFRSNIVFSNSQVLCLHFHHCGAASVHRYCSSVLLTVVGHWSCFQFGVNRARLPQTLSDLSPYSTVQEIFWGISLTAQAGQWSPFICSLKLESLKATCFLKWLYQLLFHLQFTRTPVALHLGVII